MFPLFLRSSGGKGKLSFESPANGLRGKDDRFLNLSDKALAFLSKQGTTEMASNLFHHVAAVMHAPTYAKENAGALRQNWPRVPLPAGREVLEASAALGRKMAALLEMAEIMNMARRIAALLLLRPALDANYQAVKAVVFRW